MADAKTLTEALGPSWFPMAGAEIDTNEVGTKPMALLDEPVPEEYTFGQEFTGAIVSSNPFIAEAVGPERQDFDAQPGYNPMNDAAIEAYDPNIFVGSRSPQETQSRIDTVHYMRSMGKMDQGLFGSPGSALGHIAGVFTNPLYIGAMFVPGGATGIIAAEMGAEVANETLLHSQQPERTKQESAINVATAGLLSGAGTLVYYGLNKRKAVPPLPERVGPEPDPDNPEMVKSGAVSAEVAFPETEELLDPVIVKNPWLVRVMGGTQVSPAVEVVTNSPFETVKQAMVRLVDVATEFVSRPSGTSVESNIKGADGDIAAQAYGFEESFKKYKDRGGEMNNAQFNRAVSDAENNVDTHVVPEVQTVARHYRKYKTHYFEDAKSQGMYGDSPPVANKSHQQRVYNRSQIIKTRPAMHRLIVSKLGADERLIINTKEGIFTINPTDWPTLKEKYGKDIRLLDNSPESLPGMADSIIDTILGDKGGVAPDFADLDHIVPVAGSLHERTLNFLTYDELKPWLETNSSAVMSVTTNQMYRSIEMQRAFGDMNLEGLFKEIKTEYDELRSTLKTEKERTALQKRWKKDVNRLTGLRDVLQGTYGRPDLTNHMTQAGRILKMGTLLSYGLNIPLSSLSDIVAPALRHGFKPFYHGLKVLASGQGKDYIRAVNQMGLAVNNITNSKALALANTSFMQPWEKWGNQKWSKYTGLNLFTDITQSLNAVSTSDMWLGWIKNGTSKANLEKMKQRGIDDYMVSRIKLQSSKYGRVENGITMPETHKWKDRDAARTYESALRTEVHSTTLVPGAGDMPLWTRSETGKFFTMFLSFVTSAHNKFLISGMQRRDADFLTGILATTAAGAMTVAIKDTVRGKDISDKTMDKWILDSLDRAGILGWLMPPVNQVRAQIFDDTPSSFTARRKGMNLLIPAPAKFGADVLQSGYGAITGEDRAGWRTLRVVPFANIYHASDLLERFVADEK